MSYIFKVSLIISILVVFVALTSCGPKSIAIQNDEPFANSDGLVLDTSQGATILYTRPSVPDLGAYNRFIIDPVNVIYTDPKMKELSSEQVGKMQQYLRNAVIKELRDAGYEIGTRSQAETMRISFTISGLKAPSAIGNVTAALAPIIVSVGEVTVEGVFREALTNRIDAIAVNRSQGSRILNPKPWSTWADVEDTFDNWAKGFREAVDKRHGR